MLTELVERHEPEVPENSGPTSPAAAVEAGTAAAAAGCNTQFTKGHKPSNNIHVRIKSHVYTTE